MFGPTGERAAAASGVFGLLRALDLGQTGAAAGPGFSPLETEAQAAALAALTALHGRLSTLQREMGVPPFILCAPLATAMADGSRELRVAAVACAADVGDACTIAEGGALCSVIAP